MVTRREVLTSLASLATVRLKADTTNDPLPSVVSGFSRPSTSLRAGTVAAASIRFGYAAITWGSNLTQAMDDIAAVGFRGIQLRGEAFAQYGDRPKVLHDLLDQHRLAFAVLSSGNLSIDPAREQEMLALHVQHARSPETSFRGLFVDCQIVFQPPLYARRVMRPCAVDHSNVSNGAPSPEANGSSRTVVLPSSRASTQLKSAATAAILPPCELGMPSSRSRPTGVTTKGFPG